MRVAVTRWEPVGGNRSVGRCVCVRAAGLGCVLSVRRLRGFVCGVRGALVVGLWWHACVVKGGG